MSLLGLDIGSTGAKGIVFNENGKRIASSYIEYNMIFPKPGWVELNAKEMWDMILDLIRELNTKVARDPITALSVSSFGEGFTPIDINGNILYNIIYPSDSRSIGELNKVVSKLGEDFIYQATGLTPSCLYSLSKILWIKENLREIYNKTHKFLFGEDMIYYTLGVKDTKISYSLSSRTMFFDLKKKSWSEKILDGLEIDISKFSTPVKSGTVVGVVSNKVRNKTRLPKGVKIITGGHDQPCAALGSGAIKKGIAANGIGTVESITPVFDKIVINNLMRKYGFCCEPHTINNIYVTIAYNLSAGSLLKWYKNSIGFIDFYNSKKENKDFYDYIFGKLNFTPTDLYVLPYFGSTGTPYFYPKSLGTIIGLSLSSSTANIFKSIIEGLVFEMKFNLDLLKECGIEINELRAIGGGSRSDYWLQLKSNILNIPVFKMEIDEAGCLATAIIAGLASSVYKNYDEAVKKLVKVEKEFYPKKENLDLYLNKYENYKRLFGSLRSFLNSN